MLTAAARRLPSIVESSTAKPDLGHQVQLLVTGSVVGGVILTCRWCDNAWPASRRLNRTNTKFVRIARKNPALVPSMCASTTTRRLTNMTAYLIGLGHRRIVSFKGRSDHGDANARFAGYRTAADPCRVADRR